MVSEEERNEDAAEEVSGEQEPGEEVVQEARIAELEELVARRDEALDKVKARMLELEQTVAAKDEEIAGLRQFSAELEGRLTALGSSLGEAVASYRAAVVQANPEVIEELISGDTIEAVNESLSQAKLLVSKVREGVEAEISLARVPAGAPERTSPDLSGLSPREKIQYAIGGKR